MFPRSEFRTIWEIAHNWAGHDISKTAQMDPLPEDLHDTVELIIWAALQGKIDLRRKRKAGGWFRIPPEDIWLVFFNLNRSRVKLRKMYESGDFDRDYLATTYATRADFLRWCDEAYREPPSMWRPTPSTSTGVPKVGRRVSDQDIDKYRAQGIAMAYWDIDPSIHPAHMAQCYAVRILANGRQYQDDETVKGWLADVDLRRADRKAGRPPAPNYKIDLKLPV